MTGSSQSPYIRGLATILHQHNYAVVALNQRGCSGRPNRIAKTYHSGLTEDLHQVLVSLNQRYPETAIVVAGFSLGGNQLLKYLGEHQQPLIQAAVAVSVPFSLGGAADQLNRGASRIYRQHLLSRLKQSMEQRKSLFDSCLDWRKMRAARDFWEFDDVVTAPVNGFKNVEDYYDRCSCGQFIERIRTPTLIVHAMDDPFVDPQSIPGTRDQKSPVILRLSKHGGHVGFVSGSHERGKKYHLERVITEYFQQVVISRKLNVGLRYANPTYG